MRLFHSPFSSNARRAVMTALALGSPVELSLVQLQKGEQRAPNYLAMNPNGKVPVLDDDGFFLTESHAIMMYLADKTPGQTLYPTELRARADVNRWLFWSAHHFQPSISILNWEHVVKSLLGQGPADPARVAQGELQVRECVRVLNAHLAGKTWVSGDTVTLADYALASPLMSIASAKLPVEDAPHLLAWFERVKGLDAWKKTEPMPFPS